jgi:hypothetical protein
MIDGKDVFDSVAVRFKGEHITRYFSRCEKFYIRRVCARPR